MLEDAERRGCTEVKWLPVTWICQLVTEAREEGYLYTESAKETLVNEILNLRRQCGQLLNWHQYNIPLVYTQVRIPSMVLNCAFNAVINFAVVKEGGEGE